MRDTFDLEPYQGDLLAACLNEMLNGIPVSHFDSDGGVSLTEAERLLAQLRSADIPTQLRSAPLQSIAKLIQTLVGDLDTEFSIRTGYTTEEANQFADWLEQG